MAKVSLSWIPRTEKQLFMSCVDIIFVFGIAAIALKFSTFFDHWVYFPLWPNIGDSALLLAAVIWFVLRIRALYTRK